GVDHLFTGKVERVDVELFQTLLGQGIIPVVPPLGFDGEGKTYRVNSDGVAVAVADALKAAKLLFITMQDGVICQGKLIRQLLVADLDTIIANHRSEMRCRITGSMRPMKVLISPCSAKYRSERSRLFSEIHTYFPMRRTTARPSQWARP